jgi:uncharacterized protein YcfL
MKKTMTIIFAALLLAGCGALMNPVHVENDIVMKTKRVLYETSFYTNDRYEPSYSQTITMVKETNNDNKTTYSIYDVITLPSESFEIDENKLYLIIDEEIIPFPTVFKREYNSRKISEKKEDVMKSDSTKISVVTGYDVVNKKNIQMTHILSEDIISKIGTASAVYLRYYVGASYINTEIKGGKLANVKKLISE